MQEITFPGLHLQFHISRIAFYVFNVPIYWYAIIITMALLVALLICKIRNGTYQIYYEDILNLAILLIPISLLCARFYYIIFNLDFYIRYPTEIWNIRAGGLAIYGGILGAIITIVIYCKKREINLLDMLDMLAPCLAIGQSIGRWGNFFNIEAYGTQTSSWWRMGIMENGSYQEVHPTFLYESMATFFIFLFLLKLANKRKFKGEIVAIYLMTYSLIRMIIEGFRTDSLMLGDIRISQALSIFIFIVTTVLLFLKINRIIKKRSDINRIKET